MGTAPVGETDGFPARGEVAERLAALEARLGVLRGGRTARLEFDKPIPDRMGVREELVRLAGLDRRGLQGGKRRK